MDLFYTHVINPIQTYYTATDAKQTFLNNVFYSFSFASSCFQMRFYCKSVFFFVFIYMFSLLLRNEFAL